MFSAIWVDDKELHCVLGFAEPQLIIKPNGIAFLPNQKKHEQDDQYSDWWEYFNICHIFQTSFPFFKEK